MKHVANIRAIIDYDGEYCGGCDYQEEGKEGRHLCGLFSTDLDSSVAGYHFRLKRCDECKSTTGKARHETQPE